MYPKKEDEKGKSKKKRENSRMVMFLRKKKVARDQMLKKTFRANRRDKTGENGGREERGVGKNI